MWPLPAQTTATWWPTILPGSVIEQSYDMTLLPQITAPGQVASLAAQIAPSGAGEMTATALTVVGTVLTITLAPYFGNRVYSVLFTATLHNGQVVVWIVNQGVGGIPPGYAGSTNGPVINPDGSILIGPDGNPVIAPQPYSPTNVVYGPQNANPPPASPGFGPEIVWMPASNNVASTAIGSSLVLSPIGITVANVQVNTTTLPGWLMLLDASSVPASGAVTPLRAWQVLAASTRDQAFSPSLVTVNGAVLLFSTTGPLVYTPSATAYFAGEVM